MKTQEGQRHESCLQLLLTKRVTKEFVRWITKRGRWHESCLQLPLANKSQTDSFCQWQRKDGCRNLDSKYHCVDEFQRIWHINDREKLNGWNNHHQTLTKRIPKWSAWSHTGETEAWVMTSTAISQVDPKRIRSINDKERAVTWFMPPITFDQTNCSRIRPINERQGTKAWVKDKNVAINHRSNESQKHPYESGLRLSLT